MKTKTQSTNRMLSLALAVVMVLSMLPTMRMTAFAATEVENLGENTSMPYIDGLTQYFTYDHYLYQVTFTNLKAADRTVSLRIHAGQIYLSLIGTNIGTSLDLYKDRDDQNSIVTTSDLPKAEGGSLACYLLDAASLGLQRPSIEWANSTSEPVVSIRCISANSPQWSWASDRSSATAVFTVGEADACVTLSADVRAEAEVCAQEGQITYTACVTFNGVQYTDKQTVTGILDHNWDEMEGKPCYMTCSRCDAVRVVGHSADGDHCAVCGDTLYGVLVAGNHISPLNASDVLGDGTVSYDAATNTLTLTGATVDASALNVPALEITDGLITLVLRGDNGLISYHSVRCDVETGVWYGYPAISIAEGASVIITGDASATLELAGNDFGYTTNDHIPSASAVSGGSLTVNGGHIKTKGSSGIRLSGDYTQNGGTVSIGYLEAQNVSVSGGTLDSEGWSGISPNYEDSNAGGIHGIFARKNISISGGSVTTASGVLGHNGNYRGRTAVTGEEVVTHGLYALENITVSGGTVTSTGGYGGYVIGDVGDLTLGGYIEDGEWNGTPAGAALEAPQWSISEAATFLCGSDTSHRGSTQTCRDEQCAFCGEPFEEIDHSYDETTHVCSVCGKVETFTVYWVLAGSLMQSTSTYGQDFVRTFTVPENTHLKIDSVYLNDDSSVPVKYTYENGVLTIAAVDLPAADIYIDCYHYVEVTFHANGGVIKPEEGYPEPGDTGFAKDGSYWVQEVLVGGDAFLANCVGVSRTGYTFVDWRDASGQVYPMTEAGGAKFVSATEDVTVFAQWQCNHTIGEVEFRDNEDGVTHNGYCGECGEPLGNYVERPHDYGDNTHRCVCGKKITPEVTAPAAKKDLIYDGTPQALINPGSTTGGTLQYSLDNASWSIEIPTAITAGIHTVYYKVVGDENFEDVAAQSITATIVDKTAPTGEILIKNNGWKQFVNWISFELFCKDTVDVTVTADGTGSGVAKVEYLFSATALDADNIPAEGWTEISANNGKYSCSIQPQNKGAVYVRITDEGGNATVINSDGIVVYEDSEAVDTEVHTTYGSTQDIIVRVKLNGNTIKDVKFGTQSFIDDGYCTVNGDTITLNGYKLSRLGAGSYVVTVSCNPMGIENSGVTDLTTTFTVIIDKADGEVTNINISGKTYDGTDVTAPTFDKLGDGEATIEYKVKGADESTYTTTAPKNAGDYVVRVTVAEGRNYKEAFATAEFRIAPAEIKGTIVTLGQDTFTYNGQPQKPEVTVTFNGDTLTAGVDYELYYMSADQVRKWENGEPVAFFGNTQSDSVKTGRYYAAVYGKGNFAENGRFTYATYVIEKAVINEPTIASKAYNSSAQTADIGETDLYTVVKNEGGIGKGNYGVVLKLKDSANYKWSTTDNAEVTVPFVISAAENSWTTAPAISGWTYGENANTPVGAAKYGTAKVVYSGKATDGSDYSGETAPTKAGNYTATFTVAGTEDYSGLSEQVNFTIAKKVVTVTANDASKTYGDSDPVLTYTNTALVGQDTLDITVARASGENANTYTITASQEEGANPNYEITFKTGTFTIHKAALTVTIQNATSIYGGNIAELKATDNGIVNGDTNVYSLATSATITSNVGKYAITGTALDSNYTVTFVNGEYEITKREITITVEAKNTIVNTALPTYTYKVDGLVGEDTLVIEPSFSCNADITVIGEYDITASGADAGGNYSIKYVPAKLTVLTDNAVDAAAGYTEELEDYDPATVTSKDKAELDEILDEINTILADGTITDNGKKALEEVKEQVENLIKKITDAAEATDTENTVKVEDVTAENVTPENKTHLEKAKADLEKSLEDNGGNYTGDEKNAIEDEIKRIEAAITALENVENVAETITQLPESVKPDNEATAEKILAAKEAYDALTDHEKSLVSEAATKKLDGLVAALTAYDIVEGDGSSWTEDSNGTISFTANGAFSKFVGIKVDGVDVDKTDYEAKTGSTVITLKASYLDTLKVGEHTITVVYNDGSTDGAFKIVAKPQTPATGDDFNIALYGSLMTVSATALVVLLLIAKKRNYAK